MAFGLGQLADALHEGERLSEIAESKRALDAVGVIAQLPIRSLLLEMERFVARKRRNTAATRGAGFFREGLGHAVCCNLTPKLMAGSGQRSISPNTMSSEPMIAATSASICPRLKKSIACRWANDGALGFTPALPSAAVGRKACLLARAGDHAIAPARLGISASIQA